MNRTIKAFSAIALAIATTVSLAVPANATTVRGDAKPIGNNVESGSVNSAPVNYAVYQSGKLTAEATVRIPDGWDEEDIAMGGNYTPDATISNEAVDSTEAPEDVAEEPPSVEGNGDAYVSVPLYDQTLYPDIPYGTSTVADGGCGIVCAAMIISYINGSENEVSTLAADYNLPEKNYLERMEMALAGRDINFTKTYQWPDVKAALKEGKVAIIMVNQESKFTGSQHLIVVDHINEDGTVMVKDPNGANYRRIDWYMDPLYKNGFPEKEITCGFCGGWIIEAKEAVHAEDPFC